MMKTPDEIKRGLECCISHFMESCNVCPYAHVVGCAREATKDAIAYIQQLEDGIEQWELVAASPGAVEDMARENERLEAEVANLERVRSDLTATNMQLRDVVFKNELFKRRLEEERSVFESQVPRWISVEEKKPPKHMGEYLCWCALDDDTEHKWDWAMVLRWHAFEGNGVVDRPHFTDEGVNGMYVTHWMPLPEPPKEVAT